MEAARELRGEWDVVCLKALPGRLGLEAPHFVASCLPQQVKKRPSAVELTAHPLFWSDDDVAARIKTTYVALKSNGASDAALVAALKSVKVDASSLASWRARVPPDVLASLNKGIRGAGVYGDGLMELLRFGRNAGEHAHQSPEAVAWLESGEKGAAAAAGGLMAGLVAQRLCAELPGLPMALHAWQALLPKLK